MISESFAVTFVYVIEKSGVGSHVRAVEIENAVYTAFVVLGDHPRTVPYLRHKIAVGFNGFAVIHYFGKCVYACLHGICVIALAGVKSEAVDSLVEPEFHDFPDFIPHLGIVQVKVGHVGRKSGFVKVSFFVAGNRVVTRRVPFFIQSFRFSGEIVVFYILVVEVTLVQRFHSLKEPRVKLRGMVQHKIENEMYSTLVKFLQQLVEILHCAVARINAVVVSHIIFVIRGRRKYRH